jgi:hypothetical protein
MMEEPTPTARLIDSRAVLLEEDNNDKQYHDVNNPSVTNVNVVKGETQPSQCRDAFFAVLFYAHLVAMAAVSCIYGGAALNYNGGGNENGSGSGSGNHGNGNNAHNTTGGFVYMILIVGALCSALSFVSLHILTHFAKSLIQIALVGQLVVSLGLAFGSLLAGQAAGFIIGILFFATGVCYACMVWSRIPFASAILNTAISGVRKNMGKWYLQYMTTSTSHSTSYCTYSSAKVCMLLLPALYCVVPHKLGVDTYYAVYSSYYLFPYFLFLVFRRSFIGTLNNRRDVGDLWSPGSGICLYHYVVHWCHGRLLYPVST